MSIITQNDYKTQKKLELYSALCYLIDRRYLIDRCLFIFQSVNMANLIVKAKGGEHGKYNRNVVDCCAFYLKK